MALSQPMQLTDNFQRLISFDSVYIKVSTVTGNKESMTAAIEYKDGANGPILETKNIRFPVNLDGQNSIKQAYEYLKTLPEFANSIDC